jgi:hypothetical protein
MIYNYLFYKGYQLGKWSKKFDDIYYVISFALGTLAAMYKRHYGIFS